MNTLGRLWRMTTYGGSHDGHIGVVVDGCPAGVEIDMAYIQAQMRRRRPGQSAYTTERNEKDEVVITSGLYDGKTTGTPIHMMILNRDQKSKDYDHLSQVYRPSHADYTYHVKYGIRDHRGGGRSSARETACRVAAGALAKLYLLSQGVTVQAYTEAIGAISMNPMDRTWSNEQIEASPLRCPDERTSSQMAEHLSTLKEEGDTCGGIIAGTATGLPVGLGSPIYDKLEARLASAMLSINACVGFEYGEGFGASRMTGSAYNDAFVKGEDNQVVTSTNHSGGIQGGLSNGMPLRIRCAFKPISSIKKVQNTVDTAGQATSLNIQGRHDPCVVPRAVPIVEAMLALVLADFSLLARTDRTD